MTSLWLARSTDVSSDLFHPGDRFDVIVLGAGITGLITALLLAKAGKRVAVMEARTVGAVATGNTTAKLSLLHGSKLSRVLDDHGVSVARAYVDANRAGQQWLVNFCQEQRVEVEQREAFTYAGEPGTSSCVQRELLACREAGLDAFTSETPELPFLTYGAVRLPGQYQFNPVEVLRALTESLRTEGGTLVTHLRALSINEGKEVEVVTDQGSWFAPDLVIATGFPVFNQHLMFTRLEAHRSYALAVLTGGNKPQGMYLSFEQPARSLRTARIDEEEYLLVGGEGHIVGREDSARSHIATLLDWTQTQFGDVAVVNSWSAQDYTTLDGLPLIGSWEVGQGHAFFATGYDKWGMTNGAAAALALVGRVLGARPTSWATTLYERAAVISPAAGRAISRNGRVALEMARGWCAHQRPEDVHPGEGQGVIVREGLKPVGVCQVNGQRHEVSGVCPHLGGVLRWNDAERSWDCPLHGSRFSHEGELLEGPAHRSLERH